MAQVNWVMAEVLLVIHMTVVYGPIAAFLVERFPARIRYTSMSLPYHIGNGWFGACCRSWPPPWWRRPGPFPRAPARASGRFQSHYPLPRGRATHN